MRNGLTIAVLGLSGLAILATGVVGLTDPQALFTPLGLEIEGVDARNEIRAAYGGMHIGIGVLLLVGAARASLRRAALWVGLAFMGGLTLGRLVSLAVDGMPGAFVFRLWIPEAVAAAAAAILLARPASSGHDSSDEAAAPGSGARP